MRCDEARRGSVEGMKEPSLAFSRVTLCGREGARVTMNQAGEELKRQTNDLARNLITREIG